ncbi:Disease resistance protein RPM1 [Spatholobus suberectus]|nr:Disease resistance protein RPM1 [Spatholobus suberectus]
MGFSVAASLGAHVVLRDTHETRIKCQFLCRKEQNNGIGFKFSKQRASQRAIFVSKQEFSELDERKSPDEVREEIKKCYELINRLGRGVVYLGSSRMGPGHSHYVQAQGLAKEAMSQSYTAEGLLRDMLHKFCKEKKVDPPQNVSTMNRQSLIDEVRNHLGDKRYVILFDDVWNEKFWDDIEHAVIDDKNGSRILITTRYKKVVAFCRRSSFIYVHEMQPLSEEKSLELFYKKAFQYDFDFDECCPEEFVDISLEIVKKCKGLPLAIVAIGGVLSRKDKSALEWKLFSQNISLELESNCELTIITEILGLSYDDLSDNLRCCLSYFGMYPQGYEVKFDRLIGQWIAEGFVKPGRGKTLDEVAQQYLIELILRSLVQGLIQHNELSGKALCTDLNNFCSPLEFRGKSRK